MTGFGCIAVRFKPLKKAEQRAARAWCRTSTVQQIAEKREANGGRAFLIQGGKA